MICIAISATWGTLQVMWLERSQSVPSLLPSSSPNPFHSTDRSHLRRNAILKLTIVVLAITGAIVFASTYAVCASAPNDIVPTGKCDVVQSVAAAFEWFIAFLFQSFLSRPSPY